MDGLAIECSENRILRREAEEVDSLLTASEASSEEDIPDTTTAIKEVEEAKEVVDATVLETSLPEKVTDLRAMLDNLSEELNSWRTWHQTDYLGVIETLKSQVEEIQNEWNNVSGSVTLQQEKLESLLQSFPGVIETATLKALTIRVAHLETLMSQLFSESQAQASAKGNRRQFFISLAALGVTIILWGVFIGLNVLR
jgi:hypothetical protein